MAIASVISISLAAFGQQGISDSADTLRNKSKRVTLSEIEEFGVDPFNKAFRDLISGKHEHLLLDDLRKLGSFVVFDDSLQSGLNLALAALKMNSKDLTFRGDYINPDHYRFPYIDIYMYQPLRIIKFAEHKLRMRNFDELRSYSECFSYYGNLLQHESSIGMFTGAGREDFCNS
ncbi:unnamed protein product, partial [marine sediment metagenome]